MKNLLLWLFFLLGGVLVAFNVHLRTVDKKSPISPVKLISTPSIPKEKYTESVFVPYWVSGSLSNVSYDTFYYFGIQPTSDGVIDNDQGLRNMSIIQDIPMEKKKLVLRMLDPSVTEVLLENEDAQKTLISEVGKLLQQSHFSGLVLDVEVPFTLQANKQNQITQFVQQMCTDLKSDYKTCSMLIYGDFSFRKRPYDLKKLSLHVDKILLMAYDFHKAGGEPGPNFPLDRQSPKGEGGFDYGYDFKQMISDTVSLVPKEKIEVVFGMYGYDWTLNSQGNPLKTATALSLANINSKIVKEDLPILSNINKEKNIRYSDSDGYNHTIWYEDEESVEVKTQYLQSQGIGKTSYWAYGYY